MRNVCQVLHSERAKGFGDVKVKANIMQFVPYCAGKCSFKEEGKTANFIRNYLSFIWNANLNEIYKIY